MQVEGNLFRDRFLSMQHRALVEPRAMLLYVSASPVKLQGLLTDLFCFRGKKAQPKTKEYEKHSYKRFDRGY